MIYDKVTRRKVRTRIRELSREGKPVAQIVDVLNAEGFRCPRGEPVRYSTVISQRNSIGLRKFKKKRRAAAPVEEQLDFFEPRTVQVKRVASVLPGEKPQAETESTEIALLINSLSSEQRVRLIKSLLGD